MELELVIFDCDGVLVDSEPIAARVLADAVSEVGWKLSPADVDTLFRGKSLRDCIIAIEKHLGAPLPAEFLPALERRTREEFSLALTAVPGVDAAIDRIVKAGLRVCVASSGSHDKMRFTLGHTHLLRWFDGVLFSASEVDHGKPAPDLFLHAARSMHVDPARAVVIEDSLPGVTGARAAGMRVLGFASGAPHAAETLHASHAGEDLAAQGAEVFHDMQKLPELLGISG